MSLELKKIGKEKESPGMGGGQSLFQERGHLMFDIMPGDEDLFGLGGGIQDFGLFPLQQPAG